MHTRLRSLGGVALGGSALLLYAWVVGIDSILARASAVPASILTAVAVLVIAEGIADAVGVWASIRPLGDGLSPRESVVFALAGDFFDIVSPAGAASSEPILARFISVTTETTYSEALGVRGVAKYVKAGGQVLLSGGVGLLVLYGDPSTRGVLVTLGVATGLLIVFGVLVATFGDAFARALVLGLLPITLLLARALPQVSVDRESVENAVDRFRSRVSAFRRAPALVTLIALGGVLEQVLVAVALWTVLGSLSGGVSFLAILVVVPLPQVATVAPIPASLGTYDVLLGGALVLTTGVAGAVAATTVFLFRGLTLLFGLAAGGFCAALLRGWRPRTATA